ncbi:MAG TPA: GNAT family N-acetyltransferase [Capsulimonadaceae bacterium]|nr:GNAT family N-acetyltransferase [Capsulimonadaceae bacterium]
MRPPAKAITPIMQPIPDELAGERVLVRPLRPGDGAAIWEAVDESREHLRPWMPWVEKHVTPEHSEDVARRAHGRWILREDLMVGIFDLATGRYLGGSGLHRIEWDIPSFEIGYWIRVSEEGKGYVSEAVKLLCGLAFEHLFANRVFIKCDSNNTRSAAVPKRLGFVHEATLRNAGKTPTGELRDTMIFAMTPLDYQAAPWYKDEGGKP